MKLNGNAIRPGNVIQHNGRLWAAVKISHVKPGKGGAFLLKQSYAISVMGILLNERFRASETVERVILDEVSCTYLYAEGEAFIFMNNENLSNSPSGRI